MLTTRSATKDSEKAEPSPDQRQNTTPKVWDIDDDFEYAPSKPEGDPWNVLLEPLLKKDKIQCEAWRDEVQILLIFAGLFSAVVTAFVTVSYQFLQPNPNGAVTDILSHIASRLDNPLTGTLGPPSFANQVSFSFAPSPSAIRVNIFWFVSLMLSLTTALVGIISLQWLREHQSYPGLSPKETLAIFHMRAESLEKWYVGNIFTTLPLLLQGALVLFFAGVVDFLLSLSTEVAIPVTAVIGLTLLFLIVTTVLPSFQGFYLYLPFLFSRNLSMRPSPCPYKSPQSQAFRTVSSFGMKLSEPLFPALRSLFHKVHRHLARLFKSKNDNEEEELEDHHVIPHISTTWREKSWAEFDSAWLLLRDASVHGIHDQLPGLHKHRQHPHLVKSLPLFDITQTLREAIRIDNVKHREAFLAAAYHCFRELSLSFLGTDDGDIRSLYFNDDIVLRRYQYFYALFNGGGFDQGFQYLLIDIDTIRHGVPSSRIANILHHQNINMFLAHIPGHHSTDTHRLEVKLRLMRALYGHHYALHPSTSGGNPPSYLEISPVDFQSLAKYEVETFYWQYSQVLMGFFNLAGDENRPDILQGCLHVHPSIASFLKKASRTTYSATCRARTGTAAEDAVDIVKAFSAIFPYISGRLEYSMSIMPPPSSRFTRRGTLRASMHYLFYTAAIYVRCFITESSKPLGQGVNSSILDDHGLVDTLLSSLRKYKQRTIDAGAADELLEEQFKGVDGWRLPVVRFSREWWSFLDGDNMSGYSESLGEPENLNSILPAGSAYFLQSSDSINLNIDETDPSAIPLEHMSSNPKPSSSFPTFDSQRFQPQNRNAVHRTITTPSSSVVHLQAILPQTQHTSHDAHSSFVSPSTNCRRVPDDTTASQMSLRVDKLV